MRNRPRNLKIKRGDTVLIRVGKDRGKTGRVLAVLPKESRVIVEGRNLVKKHVRPRRTTEKGQRIEAPAPMPVARVMLICPSCQKAARIGIRRPAGAGRERVCKRCGAVIP